MISRSAYIKKFSKTQKTMGKKLRAYLAEQSEKNVHDLRTAGRRVLASIRLLPKSVRDKKGTRKYARQFEKLISLNAKVRDLDLVLSRVSTRDQNPESSQLSKSLGKAREESLKPAVEFASAIRPKSGLAIRTVDLSNKSLSKRFNKITDTLKSKIEERLPVVLRDPREKEELHGLREDSRQYRYTLELGSTSKTTPTLVTLRSWQNILGLIHDSDIIIDYLQHQEKSPETQDLLREELTIRNGNYEKFASMAMNQSVFKSAS